MKVVCIIQARMGSTRLPGKVLMDLGGHPVLEWCVRAASAAPGVDEVWVATSKLEADDRIVSWCRDNDVRCWRGSETDVLSRFVGCAGHALVQGPILIRSPRPIENGLILRLTGDCPFLDPQVIGAVVCLQKKTGAAYVSNVSPRSYPDGLDVEAFPLVTLLHADKEATRAIDRDCVTTWIERNRSRFPAETVINPIPGMRDERWVLDTAEDYAFCKAIANAWPWHKGPPAMLDILGIIERTPELRAINGSGVMNERYFEALAEEPIYVRSETTRSQKALARAKEVIPLGAQTFSKSWLQYPQPSPLFLSHGDGGLCWDIDGNEYVDLVSALLPNILGYRDPDVDTAVRRQLANGISFSLATELEAELAETLCRLIPCAEAVRFGKTGTDVTTAGVRLARAFTGRERVLICGGYHGWGSWSVEWRLGVTSAERADVIRIPFGDYAAAETALKNRWHACVIVEPEQNPEYLEQLRHLCDDFGALLIFDEVITGFRFDLGGAQKHFGVIPDLATFGKAMANGMPLSALVGRKDIMKRMEPPDNIFFSGTMFGETLSLAASIATIRKLEHEAVIPRLWTNGETLAGEAERLIFDYGCADYIKLFGASPLKRIRFADDQIAALFRKEMIASGTLIIASHNLNFCHGHNEIARILKSYRHTLKVLRTALDSNDIAARLAGASVSAGVR